RIAAPVGGAVVGLSVFTEGGVIQPGARVLDVVPSDDPLIVEGRLQLTDVNDVKAGSPADVRLTSIPRSERPIVKGQVLTVSADKMTGQQTGGGYCWVRVRRRPGDGEAGQFDVRSGMP